MDLLKTILLYMTMIYASSVQNAPVPTFAPEVTPAPVVTASLPTPSPTTEVTPTPTPVPTPDITPNDEYETVRVGDNGEGVKDIQRRLAELGYYAGDIDGRFGNQTRRAVEQFQYNNGLSADGIAGKRTLTVLFESKSAVALAATETPSAETTLTPPPGETAQGPQSAQTVKPEDTTPAPTFVPTATPGPGETTGPATEAPTLLLESEASPEAPGEEETAPPAQTDIPVASTLLPLTEAGFVLKGRSERLTREAEDGGEPIPLVPLEKDGETIFIPFVEILRSSGVVVVPSIAERHMEYAFAILEDVYHLTADMDENGVSLEVVITRNRTPQIMGNRVAMMEAGMLYLPLAEMEKWTGIAFALNEETGLYTVILPTKAGVGQYPVPV